MTPINSTVSAAAIETMKSRHSVRAYKQGHKIPDEHLEEILLAASQAPSAWNLQPWKFMLIHEQADKEKLLPIAYNQKQVVESSVTVVVLGDLEADKNTERVFGEYVEKGFMPADAKERMVENIIQAYANGGERLARDHAFLNPSLAAMQLMIAAKALGYDTVPMSGFNPDQLIREFNIPARYVPVMLIPIGIAEQPGKASLRLSLDEVIYRG